ncbi:MAG: hypothetical protein FJ405_06860 [Verrucomicrobia bacterium]|nr:hypothetical protein [Verrucomicrobiota bacterium]
MKINPFHFVAGSLCFLALPLFAQQPSDSSVPAGLPVADLKRSSPVDFQTEILPLLRSSCLACHNRTKAKSDLVLETPADLRKGGESGPGVVPGKSGESLVFKLAAHTEKPVMPPKENKVEAPNLTAEQLSLLKLWIDQGASGEVKADQAMDWQPLPDSLKSVLSVALTSDGQWAAAGRANQIALYHVPTRRPMGLLTDPGLLKEGLYSKPGVAHRDQVNALVFSPDGNWLASGDYRAVNLWKRTLTEHRIDLKSEGLPAVTAVGVADQWIATGHADGKVTLWQASAGILQTQWQAHAGPIRQVKFAPGGSRVATLSGSRRIGVFNVSSSEVLNVLYIPTPAAVTRMAWLSNDLSLAAAASDQTIRTWSLQLGQTNAAVLQRELKGHSALITGLEAVPGSSQLLVSASMDGSVRWWNYVTGESVRSTEFGGPVNTLAASSEGLIAASSNTKPGIRIWEPGGEKVRFDLKGDRFDEDALVRAEAELQFAKGEVSYRQTSLDESKKREKAESDFAVKALDNRTTAEKNLLEKQKAVLAAVEARAAAEKAPAEIASELQKVIAGRDAAEAAAKQAEAEAATALARVDAAKAAAEQARKASADLAKAIEADGQKTPGLKEAKGIADKLATSADGLAEDGKKAADRLAQDAVPKRKSADETKVAAEKKIAELTERQKKAPEAIANTVKELEKLEKESETLLTAKKSSEDQWVAAQRIAKRATEAVPEAQKALELAQQTQAKREAEVETAKKTAAAATQPVVGLAFLNSEGVLASLGTDGRVQTWAVASGIGIATSPLRTPLLPEIAALRDGGGLIMVTTNGGAQALRRQEKWEHAGQVGGLQHQESPITGRVNTLEFSPDGKQLAVGSGEPSRSGELAILDPASMKWVRVFTNAHSDVVLSVSFSSDGALLASAASDRFVKVWDVATGAMARSFEGHTHHVMGVSWKRDGRTLGSVGADKVVKFWNYVTGEQRRTITGGEKELTSIRYLSFTGEWLVASADTQVKLIADDGKVLRTFSGAKDYLHAAVGTADGHWVIGGGADSVVRVWNGRNGVTLATFP